VNGVAVAVHSEHSMTYGCWATLEQVAAFHLYRYSLESPCVRHK